MSNRSVAGARRSGVRALIITLCTLHAGAVAAQRASQNTDRTALRGLEGVGVIVEPVLDEGGRYGLNRTGVRIDAEIKLRNAGIRVLSMEEYLDVPAAPYLHIDVDIVPTPGDGLFAASMRVALRQDVLSSVLPDTTIYDVTTWHMATGVSTMRAEELGSVRERVGAMVDQFVSDFVAANPRN